MEWQAEYSVGDSKMDADHLIILNLINEYQNLAASKSTREHAAFLIKELETYTKHHFNSECEYLARIAYPGLEEHKKIHAEMLNVLAYLKEQYDTDADISKKVSAFLSEWWETHILIEDMKYKEFAKISPEDTTYSETSIIAG